MGRSRDGFMVSGVARARYDFPFILEGMLEPEAVTRALVSLKTCCHQAESRPLFIVVLCVGRLTRQGALDSAGSAVYRKAWRYHGVILQERAAGKILGPRFP